MQTTSKIFVSCLLCLALVLVSGCGGGPHPSALVGEWEIDNPTPGDCSLFLGVNGEAQCLSRYTNSRIALLYGDGDLNSIDDSDDFQGTWKVKNDRLHIVGTDVSVVLEYTISESTSESTLTITNTDGRSWTFTQKKR